MDDTRTDPAVRPVYTEEWGDQLQADYEEYMGRLYDNIDAEVDDESIVDASGTFFCGCEACDRRASWTFLMVRIMTAYRDGVISLADDSPGPVTEPLW